MAESKVKIVVVGGGSVGKSCVSLRFLQGKFVSEYDPTIEENYRKMMIIDGIPTMLEVIDTAGQDEYHGVRDKYLRTGEGFLVVYSITSRPSFVEMQSILEAIQFARNSKTIPAVIVGNKIDLLSERQIDKSEASEFASKHHIPFFEASAKTGENIVACFQEVIQVAQKYKQQEEDSTTNDNSTPTIKKKRRLCILI
ncbi:ras-like protein [Anaeramoeba ignava]|uniref:Ras-like protein n=1 Tax=Anaeramoeba ignava TaxID=1746090 RepID=A0A9Q0LEI3_ANAIG|nr:ras-like protein [Anaeramoeba ignava]